MNRSTSQWRNRYGPASMRDHHLGPQALLNQEKFVTQLENNGVKDAQRFLDKRISRIPHAEHARLHENGWNKDWLKWLDENPDFTIKDFDKNIKEMMYKYNVPRSSRNVKMYGRNSSGC